MWYISWPVAVYSPDFPALAGGLKQGGKLLVMVEITTNKDVLAGRRRPRLKPSTAGLQISLNRSWATENSVVAEPRR